MTNTFLALVPTYGPLVIFICVFLSCLALPVPSSILVMTAGGFVAAGDLNLIAVLLCASLGFILGDQTAYWIARKFGAPVLIRAERSQRVLKLLQRARRLMARFGLFAIILTRTILSPMGPYVAYLSGVVSFKWYVFSLIASFSAVIWSVSYVSIGYLFSSQIAEIASIISSSLGLFMAIACALLILLYIYRSYRRAIKNSRLTD